jgi:hypothetical protein
MLGKLEFSAEKVLKNCFPKKFQEKFCRKSLSVEKSVRKIGPWSVDKMIYKYLEQNKNDTMQSLVFSALKVLNIFRCAYVMSVGGKNMLTFNHEICILLAVDGGGNV